MKKRLFIVSNRLPVSVTKTESGPAVKQSSGGLVSAIESYLSKETEGKFENISWVGMPCCDPGEWDTVSGSLAGGTYEYLPVFAPKKLYDKYYNGFSNSTIWPLFHYFPSITEYDRNNFESYQRINNAFADALKKHLRPTDILWIHDYHLMPLANIIRQMVPGITIGFFLHIPFPSFEVFRLLPKQWQHEILTGLLGADLIGFHTIDYATHFLKSVQMVLGNESDMNIIRYQNRLVKVDVFPISIDYDKFNEAFDNPQVIQLRQKLQQNFQGKRIIFSVDRLDYTKGVNHRLDGYRLFLENNPEYREKVVFVMVLVPSREYIPKYAERKKMIDEMIGDINSKIGTLHWQPVIYQYNSLSFEQMLALYTACDVALITPLRDGMNLVAKEFVASRRDKKGVLLLSEMAGAARELTTALQLNPNDVLEMAEKIRSAFEMDSAEQEERIDTMQQRIASYNVNTWANDFITQLESIKLKQEEFQVKFIDEEDKRSILRHYVKSTRRLILLDYDGTLVPFTSSPSKAYPGTAVKDLLRRLQQKGNEVYLVSGRSSDTLDAWFAGIPVHLVAEHGARFRRYDQPWQTIVRGNTGWKHEMRKLMDQYVKRCANTFIEEKDYCLVWHFRNADAEQGKLRARELFAELNEYTRSLNMQVILGNKIVELKPAGADKGTILKTHILKGEYDFILAAGDDKTDEDMFRILCHNENAFTIKIGPEASFARYNLLTAYMMTALLETISNTPVSRPGNIKTINQQQEEIPG